MVSDWPCQYTGSFSQQRTLADLQASITSSGRFLYSCKTGLLWEVTSPITDILVYTDAHLNFRIRKNDQIRNLTSGMEFRIAKLLLNFLGGDTRALKKDFTLTGDDAKSPLVLVPRSRTIRKRLTQIVVEQTEESIRVQINSPTSGDVVIAISHIDILDKEDKAACLRFNSQSKIACEVLRRPTKFVTREFEQSR